MNAVPYFFPVVFVVFKSVLKLLRDSEYFLVQLKRAKLPCKDLVLLLHFMYKIYLNLCSAHFPLRTALVLRT